ncbi:MAG: hypothetical protein M1550_00900 [Deltaproteobacteria bacterium]|nr:hypothetical protein [Deltaproteobacteria bacterium]
MRLGPTLAAVTAAGALWISGCAGGTIVPTPSQLVATGAVPRDADLAALARGRAVFVTECAACHRLFRPDEYTPQEWKRIVARMAPRASLDSRQTSDLELYLSAASGWRK